MPRLSRLVAHLALALLPLAPACQAHAESTPADAPDVVRVTGVRATPWKSYRAMRAAMEAYEKHRDLAPDAEFSFGVVLPGTQPLPPNFALRVRTPDGKDYPITMNGKAFALPILPDDALDGDLVTNLKGVPIKIGIRVETPGVAAGMDRLGDLRLTCQIDQALARFDDNFLARLIRPNVCETASGHWWMAPGWSPSGGAFVVEGQRSAPLESGNRMGIARYRVPLQDTSWGNDALLDFRYTGNPKRTPRFYYRDGG
jgi:hypothetical protein